MKEEIVLKIINESVSFIRGFIDLPEDISIRLRVMIRIYLEMRMFPL